MSNIPFNNTDLLQINQDQHLKGGEMAEYTQPFNTLTDYYAILDSFNSSRVGKKIFSILVLKIGTTNYLSIIFKND